jgi:RHS repeat-associated protein
MVGQYNASGLSVSNQLQRAVSTRTVSDGTTSNTWTYTYTAPSYSTVVTAPKLSYDSQANDTKYTVAEMSAGNFDSMFVTQIDYYQGSYSSGTLLKTVAKGLASYTNPYYQVSAHNPGLGASTAGQLLNSQTTTLSNSKVSQTLYSYDSGFSVIGQTGSVCCTFFYGVPTNETTSDYGAAPNPGPVLRQTAITYKWQTDANTLNSNLLQLKASTIVNDSGGHKCAETDYYYDDPARLFSSGITHGAPSAARGNPSSIVDQLTSNPCTSNATWTPITSYRNVYDTGMLYQSIDPLGNTTTHSYSSTFNGAYVTQTNSPDTGSPVVHHVVSGKYDFNTGLVTQFTDENSQNTSYGYDYLRRMTSTIFPTGGGQVTFAYTDTVGALQVLLKKQQTSSTWIQTTRKFDGLGRTIQNQLADPDPNGTDFTDTSYDSVGRVYSVSNPYRTTASSTDGSTQTQYDALGRVLSTTEQDGSQVSSSYNANCTTVTDEVGNARQSCADGLGRMASVLEDPGSSPHLNYTTDYTYDALGNLTFVNQIGSSGGQPRTRTFLYDSLSHLTSATNPESGTITYAYDADGNVITKTGPLPNQTGSATVTTTNTYDNLNRLTSKSYKDGNNPDPYTPTVQFGYDAVALTGCTKNPPNLTDTYPVGRRTAMCDGSGATSWIHDTMGRVLQERRTLGAVVGDYETDAYNLDGSPQSVTSLGFRIAYTYSGAARALTATNNGTSPATKFVSAATYAPAGELVGATLGSATGFAGFTVSNSYNDRLQPILLSASSPSATVFSDSFDFHLGAGDNGNIFKITNNRDSTHGRDQNFMYDSLNRIQQAYSSGTGTYSWGETFSPTATNPGIAPTTPGIDAWGNLMNRSGVTNRTYAELLDCPANANNQLTACTNAYDAAGNMTGYGTASYVYDAENRLIATAGYSYIYDGDGQRVEKCTEGTTPGTCASGATGTLYWRGLSSDPLSETNLAGTVQNTYVFFNGQRVARVDSAGAPHYYFSDHLGTHGVVENATGTVCEQDMDYYPYGGEEHDYCPNVAQNYKFTGKERDSESGLDNFGARYNASSLGRFMTPDPSPNGIAPGDPQSWNLYSYVRNRPTRSVDVGGNWATDVHAEIVTVALQGLVSAGELKQLVAEQYVMDKNQAPEFQYRHAMSNGQSDPPQSAGEASNKMWDYVATMMGGASATLGSNGQFNSVSLAYLGDAIHTVEDYTSPMHTSPSGDPLPWYGASHGGFRHWQGENSPSDSWAGFGQAVRLTMAAFMQVNPELAKKNGLTEATFNAEADRRISQYVENFFRMSGNVMSTDHVKEEAARQCALGNPAACD